MKKSLIIGVLSALIFVNLTSCDDDNDPKQTFFEGEEITLGDGRAASFAETDANGKVTKLGFIISEASMNSLPHDHEMYEFSLDLPSQASQTEFQHLTLDWNPHGHEPDDIYTVPHFDFHFYMISETGRQAIDPENAEMEELPSLNYIPTGYFPTPGGVPMMGKHWLDSEAPELNGEEFGYTFIYGSYAGEVIFMEPMITKAQLTGENKNTTYSIKQPSTFKNPSKIHPKNVETVYDAAKKEYRVFLKNWE